MKKFIPVLCLLALVGLLLPLWMAFASYSYYIPITVYNNSTTSYSYIPVLVTLNNTQLASLGYIDSNGLNTTIIEGASDREYMLDGTRVGVVIPSLLNGQSTGINYRLNNQPPQSALSVVVGMGGNFTVDDDASLELGSNFTLEYDGYVDTTKVGSNLTYKQDSIRVYISDTGNITAQTTTSIQQLLQDSQVNLGTGSSVTRAGQRIQSYNGTVSKISFYLQKSGSPVGTAYARIRAVSDNSILAEMGSINVTTLSSSYSWYDFNGNTTVFTPTNVRFLIEYSQGDAGNGIRLGLQTTDVVVGNETYFSSSAWTDVTGSEATFKVYSTPSVVATGISSGDYNILVGDNTTNLRIEVDGAQKDSLAYTGTVDNTVDNWELMAGNSTPYLNYYKHNVSGVQRAWYQPTTIVSPTNLPDRSGNGNAGTINFGVNPTGIEITVGAITPLTGFVSTNTTTESEIPIVVSSINTTMSENTTADVSGLPMYPSFITFAASMGWSVPFAYSFFFLIGGMGVGFLGWKATSSIWGFMGGFLAIYLLGLGSGVLSLWGILIGLLILGGIFYLWNRT